MEADERGDRGDAGEAIDGGGMLRVEPSEFIDTELMQMLSDELRVRIYAYLCEHTAGAVEIASALEADKGMVRYHVGLLMDGGWIEVDATARGRAKKFRAVRSFVLPAAVWDQLPEPLRKHIGFKVMRRLYVDAAESMEAGLFARPGVHLSITPMVVDGQGQRESKELLEATISRLLAIQEESDRRGADAARGDGQAVAMTIALAGYEACRSPDEGVKASRTIRL